MRVVVCRGGAAHLLPRGVGTALEAGAVGQGVFTQAADRQTLAGLLEGMLVAKILHLARERRTEARILTCLHPALLSGFAEREALYASATRIGLELEHGHTPATHSVLTAVTAGERMFQTLLNVSRRFHQLPPAVGVRVAREFAFAF